MTTCPHCGVEQTECGHCGKPLSNRSESDHRRFFALIRAAFHHWPEGHEFVPSSAEALRAWLLCKAGHSRISSHELPDDPTLRQQMVAFGEALLDESNKQAKESTEFRFGRWHGASYAVFAPKSIDWRTVSQKAFNHIRETVTEVIEAETGQTAETLLRETEKAA